MEQQSPEAKMNESGSAIRAVCRSIAVLKAINRQSSLSMMELARTTGLPYPTVSRIIHTLLHEGLIEVEPTRKRYRVTALVQTLSVGFRDQGPLLHVARPHLVALTRKLSWPVTLSTRVGQQMMVRDSTHAITSLTFNNYHPGYTMPILECAAGQAYLAYAPEDEFSSVLQGLEMIKGKSSLLELFKSGKLPQRIREDGYTTLEKNRHSAAPGKTSSLAVPIFDQQQVVAALTLTIFSTSMTMSEACKRYVMEVKSTGERISAELSSAPDAGPNADLVPSANASRGHTKLRPELAA